MPSQQSSFPFTRHALMPHVFIPARHASSERPSKVPHASAHAYWVPDRFTPRSWTGLRLPSTSWLPLTRSESGVGGGDVLVEVPVDVVDDAAVDAPVDELVDEPVEAGAVDEAG